MAFVLTPSFAPAYQAPQCNPFGFCAPVSRSPYAYRVTRPQPRRPQHSPYGNFFSQVNDLLSEIDREAQRQAQLEAHREAQREAYRQRQQQRKRTLRAKFDVNPSEQGWSVEGDIQGFDSENISIEVTDEHTLKISGNTQWQSEKVPSEPQLPQIEEKSESASAPAVEQSTEETSEAAHNEPEVETTTEAESTTAGVATPDSDTMSHKSYQATVEDDFEDLGDELSSSSSRPSTPVESKEPKGKEKAVEEPVNTETAVVTQPQPEVPAHQPQEQHEQQERVHGSFTRSFRFPSRIDVANVSASFKDGVLRVNVPRAQAPQVRRITIQ
jgi:HSP20 family molecular chaperone IbpA